MQERTGSAIGALVTQADGRRLLDRILDSPRLAQSVPSLAPALLHQVLDRCGLEDSGELLALATPAQIAGVLDLDLWRPERPGADAVLDADRFGVWLEVLADLPPEAAARIIAGLDPDLVAAGFTRYVRVFDAAAVGVFRHTDGDLVAPGAVAAHDGTLSCEVGGQRVVARRLDTWDAVVAILVALDTEQPAAFRRLTARCRQLSHGGTEMDGLEPVRDAAVQAHHDLASGRDERSEAQGHVTPADARAFLARARQAGLVRRSAWRLPVSAATSAALVARDGAGATVLESHLQQVLARDTAAYAARSQELAFLANVLAAGTGVLDRPFTPPEAAAAARATCNLGLLHWPELGGGPLPEGFLVGQDLIAPFEIGWTVLHDDVAMATASRLVEVLAALHPGDTDTVVALAALRAHLVKHCRAGTPWRARDAMDVLASVDLLAWTALLGLIAECPVAHGALAARPGSGVLAVDPGAFSFIADDDQLRAVREFVTDLPALLGA
jgi:hypothetical protein